MVQRQLELFPLSTSMKLLLLLVVLARCSCSIVAAPAADTIGAVSTDAERGRPASQVGNAAGAAYGEELEDADDHDSDTSEEAPADIVTTALVVACSAADDFAVHSAAGRQKGRKNNARSRTWESVGGDEERTFVESYRRKIDAGGASSREVFASGFKIHPPDPAFKHFGPNFSPKGYRVSPVFFFVPDAAFPRVVPTVPCPYCCKPDCVKPVKWAGVPRWVLGMEKNFLLDTKVYHCDNCHRDFRGTRSRR